MTKNFEAVRAARFRPGRILLIAAGVLAVLNALALYLFVAPPGGSKAELEQTRQELGADIQALKFKNARLQRVASTVQTGGAQAKEFEDRYFLPEREAYATVIAEIHRMAAAASLRQRDAVYTEEPIEGSDDLSLLTVTANFEGNYPTLNKFFQEEDQSPMLLMLDSLSATPQSKGELINTSIRFQSIVRESEGIAHE
jgi:Tfp pilus assembly protein PilO